MVSKQNKNLGDAEELGPGTAATSPSPDRRCAPACSGRRASEIEIPGSQLQQPYWNGSTFTNGFRPAAK